MNILRLAVVWVFLVMPTAIATGEPLAVFECREVVGKDWPRMMVTYPLEFKPGHAQVGNLRLLDGQGKEVTSQVWKVKTHADGSCHARIEMSPCGANRNVPT
jgi:hypothetical protein